MGALGTHHSQLSTGQGQMPPPPSATSALLGWLRCDELGCLCSEGLSCFGHCLLAPHRVPAGKRAGRNKLFVLVFETNGGEKWEKKKNKQKKPLFS